MSEKPARGATNRYDVFKFVVAAILVGVIVILLVPWERVRPVFRPTPTQAVSAVTVTPSPSPTSLLGSTVPTSTPAPTPEIEPPTFTGPAEAVRVGEAVLSGTGTPGSKVCVIVNGEIIVTTIADQDGNWTLTTTIDEPGQYEVQVQTVDENGEVLAESSPAALTVIAALAPLSMDVPELGEFIFSGDGQTVGRLAISGRGEPGTVVHIRAGDQLLGSEIVDVDGDWRFDEQVTLPPGTSDLVVQMSDNNDRVLATSEAVTVEITGKPAIAAPTLILRSDEGVLTISGTGTPGSQIEIVANEQVLDTVVVGENGQWSFAAQLEPGEYVLYARAIDEQGHAVGESGVANYTQPLVDITGPVLTFPLEGAEISSGTIVLSGVGIAGSSVEIIDNGKFVNTAIVQADGTWTFEYEIGAGAHVLAVQTAQNLASLSPPVSIRVIQAVAADSDTDQDDAEQADAGQAGAGEVSSGTCPADPPRGEDRGDTYVVAYCEYINLIALRTGVDPEALLAANPQIGDPNMIHEGQILNLPARDQ
ncbi:MAG: hypothetical protein JXA89_00475 [Anaerolineae bacterium]|nr:hypothetical protein [Anaerolineae bacterium]